MFNYLAKRQLFAVSSVLEMSTTELRTLKSPIKVTYDSENLTADEFLYKQIRALESFNAEWMIDGITHKRYKYNEFITMSNNAAVWFHQSDMKKGDVLLYLTHNFSALPLLFTAVWKGNGIVSSAHPEDSEANLLEKVQESSVKWIYCEPEDAERALRVAAKCASRIHVITNGTITNCVSIEVLFNYPAESSYDIPSETTAEDIAMILSTSGTTGRSRGVVRTHRSIISFISTHNLFPWQGKNLLQFKATHATGSLVPLGNLAKGVTTVSVWKADSSHLCEAVHQYKPWSVAAFPLSLMSLVKASQGPGYDFSSVRTLITGGAHMTVAMRRTMKELLYVEQLLQVYGLSECAAVIASVEYNPDGSFTVVDPPPRTNGRVAPGKEIQIRHPDTEEVYGPEAIGEICIKSPELFSYYLNNAKATVAAFTADGYFKTRDLGYYDENHQITIVGRMDDVFNYDGKLVSLDYLDDIINDHPAVDQVCTVSVLNDKGNMVPRAFVTLKPNVTADADEIVGFIQDKVPDHMLLRGGVRIVQDLPRGTTGKISRMLVSRMSLP